MSMALFEIYVSSDVSSISAQRISGKSQLERENAQVLREHCRGLTSEKEAGVTEVITDYDCGCARICFYIQKNTVFCSLSAFIFSGSNALIFLEGSDKVALIIKAVSVCDFRNGIVGGGKLVTSLFNSLAVQIIHRSLMGHFRKKSAEIFW